MPRASRVLTEFFAGALGHQCGKQLLRAASTIQSTHIGTMELCRRCRSVLAEGAKTQPSLREYDCNVVEGASSCGPCRQLQELEVQIIQVETLLEHLKRRLPSIKTERNRIHDHLMRSLPPEIMSRIFSFYVFSSGDSVDLESTESPLFLGAVCRAWRKVAWDTPSLWSSLKLLIDKSPSQTIDKSLGTRVKVLQEGFACSGGLPLSLSIYSPSKMLFHGPGGDGAAWKTLIGILDRYSKRWRVLDFQLPVWYYSTIARGLACGFPNLRHLTLIPDQVDRFHPYTLFGSASPTDIPAPTVVELARLQLNEINISWANVVHLELSHMDNKQCLDFLRRATQVTYFKLRNTYASSMNSPENTTHFTHPRLRVLDCMGPKDFPALVRPLLLPSLEEIQYYNASHLDFPYADIKELVLHSFCQLKRLCLHGDLFRREEALMDLLFNLPSVEVLTLDCPLPWNANPAGLFSLLSHCGSMSNFLPNLIKFVYKGSTVNFPWGYLVQLAVSRSFEASPKQPARPLSLVHIQSVLNGNSPRTYIPKVAVLAILAAQGMRFKLDRMNANADLTGIPPEDWLDESMKHHGIYIPDER
ncbi:unnamed protein product [Cyclocybe aegerita]|uniref:F-box domain-containing protein n=1 Tax=Cyclocybe aegerita TaxID=1973307 RepID=A0A8S0W0E6_CYCAE|nr:unnamed protein product [Cyclocybe aegerita]